MKKVLYEEDFCLKMLKSAALLFMDQHLSFC